MEAHSLLDNNRQGEKRMKANSNSVFPECIHFLEVKSLSVLNKLVRFCQGRVLYKTEDSGFHSLCTTATTGFIWHLYKPVESSLVHFGKTYSNFRHHSAWYKDNSSFLIFWTDKFNVKKKKRLPSHTNRQKTICIHVGPESYTVQ